MIFNIFRVTEIVMKRIFISIVAVVALFDVLAQSPEQMKRAKELYMNYAVWGRAQSPGMVVPMSDGEHYTRIHGDAIERIRYVDGACDTLYMASKGVSEYKVAKDGSILVGYGSHPIYRHSFSVDSLIYVAGSERIVIAPEIVDKRDASLSPDGRKVIFSSRMTSMCMTWIARRFFV